MSFSQILKYKFSLLKNVINSNDNAYKVPWWNQITKHIIVGGLPLKTENHDMELINYYNVKYVLSILNDYEFESTLGITPIRPEEWQDLNVTQKIIRSNDFEAMTFSQICEGVKWIETCITKIGGRNESIYVHCKGGHGRSPTVVICYLMKSLGIDYDEAIRRVSKKRLSVNLNKAQRLSVVNYFLNYPNS
jgi:atypical dual specificity phosphatase